ncbi:MAG: caspase family protein [Bacteroidetes bacterium]|nr:caspase family protein [Bacteroidota bacterium]
MKKLLLILVLLISFFAKSQNLYDIRWTNAGTEYFGFMVFFSEDDVYMRTGYYGADGAYNLVHSEYKYSIDEETGDVITMVATSSEFVQHETDDEWDPDHLFWYRDETTGEFAGPFIISNSDLVAENYENIIEPEFVEVDMAWINAEYLQFFYYTNEYDYSVLLAAGQDYAAENNSGSGNVSSFQNTTDTNENTHNTSFSNNSGTTDDTDNTAGNTTTTDTGANTDNTTGGTYSNLPVKIHLIVVANTLISDIGSSTQVDVNNILGEVTGISEAMGVDMNNVLISDKQFTKKNVETFMASFNPGPNDVVIFMYSGHGYRFSNQTEKYPQLDMRYSEYQPIDDAATMNLKQVFDVIVQKGARLNLVLGDCCNSDIGFSRSVGSSFMNSRSSVDPDVNKLKQLFLMTDGDIIAAGASKGEYSWCTMNNGGFFTCSFIGALREEISKFKQDDEPDWGDVMTGTVNGTLKKSELCTECNPQNVVYDKFMK